MRYEAQKVFAFSKMQDCRAIIPDSGTSLTVEAWSGADWVEDTKSPITSPQTIFTNGINVRVTPDVGGYFIDDAESL